MSEVRVGDPDPVVAVDDEYVAGHRYDTIVISTLPAGISRWIKMDVVSRLQRKRPNTRVVHVECGDPNLPANVAGSRSSRKPAGPGQG